MSTVVEPTVDTPQKQRQVLDEPTRRAIVARVMESKSIRLTAQEFGVHVNTVSRLWRRVRSVRNASVNGWRQKLTETLPAQSVDAIERSINDEGDVHKAAATALSHLKGIGALQNDSVQVTVATMISSVPSEWADRYVSAKPTVDVPSSDRGK